MTTDQHNEVTIRTAERLANEAYKTLADVAVAISDGAITLAEAPGLLPRLEMIAAITAQTIELVQAAANATTWVERLEKEKAS